MLVGAYAGFKLYKDRELNALTAGTRGQPHRTLKGHHFIQEEDGEKKEKKDVSVIAAMAILGGYILSMDWIGFDVATFLFIAALMFLQGERRIAWLAGFSLVFAFLVSIFFEYMIPYPMPMLLGKEFIGGLL